MNPVSLETIQRICKPNGNEIIVAFLDGRQESVIVRYLPARLLPQLQKHIRDESMLVEIFTGKESAWVDGLAPEGHEAILLVGWAINKDNLSSYSTRSLNRALDHAKGLLRQAKNPHTKFYQQASELIHQLESAASHLNKKDKNSHV